MTNVIKLHPEQEPLASCSPIDPQHPEYVEGERLYVAPISEGYFPNVERARHTYKVAGIMIATGFAAAAIDKLRGAFHHAQ